jgi:hypothetical protein
MLQALIDGCKKPQRVCNGSFGELGTKWQLATADCSLMLQALIDGCKKPQCVCNGSFGELGTK